jgi:TonB-dependent receptor
MNSHNHNNKKKFLKKKLAIAVSTALILSTSQFTYAAEKVEEAVKEAAEIEKVAKAKKSKARKSLGINENLDETEVIEVTGFRGSATKQLNSKRFSNNISDAIFAEDMGKMPDANIAEAMSRITGIGIDRVDGEGTEITIRGVEGSLNNVQMNGVNMTNSGDDNSVDFSSMSADMLRSIEVIKSPSANHDEGSLGGTVRLNTWKPLDIKERKTVVTVKANYNDLSEEYNPTVGISFGNNFSDNFGMTASVNYSKNTTRQDRLTNWRWQFRNASNATSLQTGEELGANYWVKDVDEDGNGVPDNTFVAGSGNTRVFDAFAYEKNYSLIETENLSLASSFQYQINDDASVWLDVTHSDRSKTKLQYNHTVQNLFTGPSAHVIDEESQTSVSIDGPRSRARIVAFEQPLDSKTTTLGLNYQQLLFDGAWTLDAMFGYSNSTSFKPVANSRQVLFNSGGGNTEAATIDWIDDNGNTLLAPEYSVAGSDDGSFPSERIPVQTVQYLTRDSEDESFTYQLDLQGDVDFGPIVGIGMGTKVVSRERNSTGFRFYVSPNNIARDGDGNPILDDDGNQQSLGDITLADYSSEFPADDFLTRVLDTESNGWDIPNLDAIYSTFVTGDLLSTIDRDGELLSNLLDDEDPATTTFDSTAIYLMANFDFFDGRLTGDFGVRWIKTEALARGRAGFNFSGWDPDGLVQLDDNGDEVLDANGDPIVLGGDFGGSNFSISDVVYGNIEYTNTLPSFNARYTLTEDMLLRFSVAKVMSRPKPSHLVPGYAITSRQNNEPSAVGGNPDLTPTEVIQYDLSWEWYFDESAMVSAAAFYKDFQSMSYTRTVDRGFSDNECASADEFPLDQQQYRDLICAEILDGVSTRTTVNGDGGEILGIETSYQQDFSFLPGWAKHFGTVINYTYADSEASFVDSSDTATAETADLLDGFPMLNTSKHTFNGTLYWENEGFSARIAYNFRSKRLNNASSFDGALWTDDRTTVDFSARYKATKNLAFTFAATNLTDTYNRVFVTRLNEDVANGLFSEGNALDGDAPTWRTYIADHNGRNFRVGMTYKF